MSTKEMFKGQIVQKMLVGMLLPKGCFWSKGLFFFSQPTCAFFKVNSSLKLTINTSTMSQRSLRCLYCSLRTDLTHCSGLFVDYFQQLNTYWYFHALEYWKVLIKRRINGWEWVTQRLTPRKRRHEKCRNFL